MKYLLFLALATVPLAAFSQTTEECGEIHAPVAYRYCVTKTLGSPSKEVLYYLHGGGGDEHQWRSSSVFLVHEALRKSGRSAPIVVTISFGPAWLLVTRNSAPESGLLEIFRDSVMPTMERLALGGTASRRLLVGASMGGFNAAQALMRMPRNTFARAVLLCPAVLEISPFASDADMSAYLEKIGESPGAMAGIVSLVKANVSDEATWNQEVSPVPLSSRLGRNLPPTLVAANSKDIHFLPGAKAFADSALQAGAPVVWREFPGHHCALTESHALDIASFLSK